MLLTACSIPSLFYRLVCWLQLDQHILRRVSISSSILFKYIRPVWFIPSSSSLELDCLLSVYFQCLSRLQQPLRRWDESLQFGSMMDLCQYSLQVPMWWRFYTKFKTLLITKNLRQLKLHPSTRLPVGICTQFYWAVIFSLPKLGPRFKVFHCRIWPTRNHSQIQSTVYASELIWINRHISFATDCSVVNFIRNVKQILFFFLV